MVAHRRIDRGAVLLVAAVLATGCLGAAREHSGRSASAPPTARVLAALDAVAPDSSAPSAAAATPLVHPAPTSAPTTDPGIDGAPAGGQPFAPEATPRPGPSPRPTAAPEPSPGPTPAPPVALDPPPGPGKFRMDLYRPGDHVRQVTTSMCVPASMQMMINMMESGPADRTRQTQRELYQQARSFSPWLTAERGGASARGWAAVLTQMGYGNFQLLTLPTMDEALRSAARQMRLTGKPVGLLVWSGRHAWVMSGFKASADPAWTNEFEVSAVWLEDPWYGRTDRTWGAGLQRHTLMSTADLRSSFVSWRSRHWQGISPTAPRFVIVAPLS